MCHLLQVLCCNRGCISSCFRDNGPQTFWGHDLDLSRSRDVIDHVTNRFPIGPFLLVLHWYQVSNSKRFRDIQPQNPCAHTHADRKTHRHTPQSDFIFCPKQMQCIALDRQKYMSCTISTRAATCSCRTWKVETRSSCLFARCCPTQPRRGPPRPAAARAARRCCLLLLMQLILLLLGNLVIIVINYN